jgi:hypothetical protein
MLLCKNEDVSLNKVGFNVLPFLHSPLKLLHYNFFIMKSSLTVTLAPFDDDNVLADERARLSE